MKPEALLLDGMQTAWKECGVYSGLRRSRGSTEESIWEAQWFSITNTMNVTYKMDTQEMEKVRQELLLES